MMYTDRVLQKSENNKKLYFFKTSTLLAIGIILDFHSNVKVNVIKNKPH